MPNSEPPMLSLDELKEFYRKSHEKEVELIAAKLSIEKSLKDITSEVCAYESMATQIHDWSLVNNEKWSSLLLRMRGENKSNDPHRHSEPDRPKA